MNKPLATFILLVFCLACHEHMPSEYEIQQINQLNFPTGKWIDLTYPFDEATIVWPTSDMFKLDTIAEGFNEQGFYYSAYKFSMAEHGGTHIDAPVHFGQGRKSVDQLEINQLSGKVLVIDLVAACKKDRDYLVTVEDIQQFESNYGAIPDHCILFFMTGFGTFWPDPLKYLGTNEKGNAGVEALHFPGLSASAAEWLLANHHIRAVGIDTPSIDYGQSKDFKVHQVLAANDIPILENVANMNLLPTTGAWVIALPLKIRGGSGAPVRIAALIP